MTNCMIFFFDTEFNGHFRKAELNNGSILFDMDDTKYEFLTADVKPINFVKNTLFGGNVPLYFVKWDELVPVNFELDKKIQEMPQEDYMEEIKRNVLGKVEKTTDKIIKKIPDRLKIRQKKEKDKVESKSIVCTPFNLKFSGKTKVNKKNVIPEMLRSTADMRFIKSMKEASMMTGKKGFRYRNLLLVLVFVGSVLAFTLYGMSYLGVF